MRQPYPIIELQISEPSSNFIEWVAHFKPTRLARSLRVSRSTVHTWVTNVGSRRKPRFDSVMVMIELSKLEPLHGEIVLTATDILGEVQISNMEIYQ